MSGTVRFKRGRTRLGTTFVINQVLHGAFLSVAYDDGSGVRWWSDSREILFKGGAVPRDGRTVLSEERFLSDTLQHVLIVLAVLGMAAALTLLAINIRCRHRKIIKLSSPTFNNVIAIGSFLCYLDIVLYSLDGNLLPHHVLNRVCMIRAWLFSLGFTLTFGGLFLKTWRVYKIFKDETARGLQIKDSKLFLMLIGALVIDGGILSIWQLRDPLVSTKIDLPVEIYDSEDKAIYPFTFDCVAQNSYTYMGIIYVVKGLLLLYGAFLANETKTVKIDELNDSKMIGVAIYNVSILCVIGAPLVAFIEKQKDLIIVIVGSFIFFGTTLVMTLVFIPKVIQLRRSDQEVTVSTVRGRTMTGAAKTNPVIQVNVEENITECIADIKRAVNRLHQSFPNDEELQDLFMKYL